MSRVLQFTPTSFHVYFRILPPDLVLLELSLESSLIKKTPNNPPSLRVMVLREGIEISGSVLRLFFILFHDILVFRLI